MKMCFRLAGCCFVNFRQGLHRRMSQCGISELRPVGPGRAMKFSLSADQFTPRAPFPVVIAAWKRLFLRVCLSVYIVRSFRWHVTWCVRPIEVREIGHRGVETQQEQFVPCLR